MAESHLKTVPSRPAFWLRLSIAAGNLLQLVGILIGSGGIYLASQVQAGALVRVVLMILGWLMIYICCHSLGHWLVGTLMGIRFRGYGIRGTDHPEELGPMMRTLLTRFPMFTAITEKASMDKAKPLAKALMFAAGETSTIVWTVLAGIYAWYSNIPGGLIWPIIAVGMSLIGVNSTSTMPRGDYAKARKALHSNR